MKELRRIYIYINICIHIYIHIHTPAALPAITGCFNTFIYIVIGRTRLGYCCVSFLKFEIYMYAPSDFGKLY